MHMHAVQTIAMLVSCVIARIQAVFPARLVWNDQLHGPFTYT